MLLYLEKTFDLLFDAAKTSPEVSRISRTAHQNDIAKWNATSNPALYDIGFVSSFMINYPKT